MIPLHDDNPTHITPIVTVGLIVVCVLVFFWQLSLGDQGGMVAVYRFGVIPAVLLDGQSLPPDLNPIAGQLTVLTSMFLHGGWMHLIGNMLYLWIFGNNIEDSMGHVRFVVFYVLCGVAAALAQALADPSSEVPMIGASGAISGVLGAYLLLHPHARIRTLIFLGFLITTIRLPASIVLGGWIVLQLISYAGTPAGQEGGVAWLAHIGGFIAGMLLIGLFKYRHVPFFEKAGSNRSAGWVRGRRDGGRKGPWG